MVVLSKRSLYGSIFPPNGQQSGYHPAMSATALEYYSIITTAFVVLAPIIGYRLAGPRISVRAFIEAPDDINRLYLEINNNGGSGVTLDLAGVDMMYFYGERLKTDLVRPPIVRGPNFPVRLEGKSFETWELSTDFLRRFASIKDGGNSMKLVLKLGGFHRKRSFRIRRIEAIVIDANGWPVTSPK
jgi:hypothetical protein